MSKQMMMTSGIVFLVWAVLDFIVHGMLLADTYKETAHLWRPEEEMNMPLMWGVTLIFSGCFVYIYEQLINPKSQQAGIKYGLILGVATGISMGIGSYCYMPIPFSLAFSWLVGSVIELSVAGYIVGMMVKDEDVTA